VRLAREDQGARNQALDAKKNEALALRLVHVVKRIVLAANLPHVASPQIQSRYDELMALESGSLDRVRNTGASTAQAPVANHVESVRTQ
jgi:hypothetical protein